MARSNAVWGIEIGQCGLKALKLRPADGERVELVAFDVIEHEKLLSQPDADPDELIRDALAKFASRNEYQGDRFVIGVPGQQTFARFCKLPPVEAKKIPEIVRFEASQQIPFEMDDVVWDYQVFQAKDMPDVEVGIFAIRKDLIRKHLEHFTDQRIGPTMIQTIPSALYNFCYHEVHEKLEEDTATVVVDVGTQHTDLIIVEENSAWSRNIPLGGNAFTDVLVKAFKLNFAKAEQLKRTAATSKYARQVFQAMRPVFADLVAEIQRSLGFYSSTHREVELTRVLACGSAFRLPGLQKYLENNLTIAGGVTKLESFDKMITEQTPNASEFTENAITFGPAYGLALQGLGLAKISANLLPPELARVQLWKKKQLFFAATAACVGLAAAFPWMRISMDKSALAAGESAGSQAKTIVDSAQKNQSDYRAASTDTTAKREKIDKLFELQKDRDLMPRVFAVVHESLPPLRQAELARVNSPDELKALIKQNAARLPRVGRGQVVIEKLDIEFAPNIDEFEPRFTAMSTPSAPSASPSGVGTGRMAPVGTGVGRNAPGGRAPSGRGFGGPSLAEEEVVVSDGTSGFWVTVQGRLLFGTTRSEAADFVTNEWYPRIQQLANRSGQGFFLPKEDPKSEGLNKANLRTPQLTRYGGQMPIVPTIAQPGQPSGESEVLFPDPITGEDMSDDWVFQVGFKFKLGDPPEAPEADGTDQPGE